VWKLGQKEKYGDEKIIVFLADGTTGKADIGDLSVVKPFGHPLKVVENENEPDSSAIH